MKSSSFFPLIALLAGHVAAASYPPYLPPVNSYQPTVNPPVEPTQPPEEPTQPPEEPTQPPVVESTYPPVVEPTKTAVAPTYPPVKPTKPPAPSPRPPVDPCKYCPYSRGAKYCKKHYGQKIGCFYKLKNGYTCTDNWHCKSNFCSYTRYHKGGKRGYKFKTCQNPLYHNGKYPLYHNGKYH